MTTCFSQRDPRWAGVRLGDSELTIGEAGCLLTAVASLLADWAPTDLATPSGFAIDPGRLNGWLIDNGGFVDGGRFVFGSVEPLGARVRAWVDYYATPANLARIARALAAGWGALALVDARPGCDVQAHWVRVLQVQGRDCLIMDPWRNVNEETISLAGQYGRSGRGASCAIFVYVAYARIAPEAALPRIRRAMSSLARISEVYRKVVGQT